MATTGRKDTRTRSENRKVIKHMNSLCKKESVKVSPFYPPVMRVTEQRSTVVLSMTPVKERKKRN